MSYNPLQSMNAFATGQQIGAGIRNQKTQNAFSQKVGENDVQGARDYAYDRGSLELGGYADQMIAGQQMQAQQAQASQADGQKAKIGQLKALTENMMGIPEAQRGEFLMNNWQNIEPIVGTDFMTFHQAAGGDYSDASLNEDLAMFRSQLGEGPASPEYGFMNVDGQLFQTDKTSGDATALTERQPDAPKFETITTDQGIFQYDPNNPKETMQHLGDAPVKTPLAQVTVNGEQKPSIFDDKVDTAAADEYIAWTQGGGADAVKQLDQVSEVLTRLKSGEDLTGPLLGMVPQNMRVLFNEGSVDAQQLIEEVVQRNLRLILGAQFTEKEGAELIKRAYNPQLDEAVNAKRLSRLFTQMSTAAQQKQSQMDYLEENRTLRGYRGATPAMADFFAVLDEESGGANSPSWTPDKQRRYDELLAKRNAGTLN